MFKELTDSEKQEAQKDTYQFIINTRIETLQIIKKNFRNVMILSLGFAWYLNNWWILIVGILFSFFHAWYTSIKWSKYIRRNAGVSEEEAIDCWKLYQISNSQKR